MRPLAAARLSPCLEKGAAVVAATKRPPHLPGAARCTAGGRLVSISFMAPSTLRLDRVFCLEESVWADKIGLSDQTSVLPSLDLLRRMGAVSEFVHRHAFREAEFESYLRWRQKDRRVRTYGTVFFAFHGTSKGLDIGNDELSLDDLARQIGSLPDGVVHLGSCSVLRRNEAAVHRFLDATGARLLSGYERDVEWLDCAALDTAWVGYIASYDRLGDALRYFKARYASLISHLKWQAVEPSK